MHAHGLEVALELQTLEMCDPQPEGGRGTQDRLGDRTLALRPCERREHEPRPPLLHQRGRRPDVERPGREGGLGRVWDELGREVVEVRLDQRNAGLAWIARERLADEHAHEVRALLELARPGPVADGLEAHRRQRPVALTESGYKRTPGGGHELRRDLDAIQGSTAQQRERGRRRKRQPAVGGVHEPAWHGQRRADEALDAEVLERERGAADVGERVDRAELVEVHLLRGDRVDGALGLGEAPEGLLRARTGALREPGRVDQLADLGQAPARSFERGDHL